MDLAAQMLGKILISQAALLLILRFDLNIFFSEIFFLVYTIDDQCVIVFHFTVFLFGPKETEVV